MDTKKTELESETVNGLRKIYSKLEDQESRDIFLARVNCSITDAPVYILEIARKYYDLLPDLWKNCITDDEFTSRNMKESGVIFYGAGEEGRTLLEYYRVVCPAILESLKYFVDRSAAKQKDGVPGYPVFSQESFLEKYDNEFVFIATARYEKEVKEWLVSNKIPNDKIIDLFKRQVYASGAYFYNDFTRFEKDEVFLDCGACDLATSIEFLLQCPGTKKIYAFEAEERAYQLCCDVKREKKLDTVEILPYACWSRECELSFENRNLGSSMVNEGGAERVKAMPLDAVVDKNDKVTFIKMDIEGAELEALKGAREIIKRDKPKLAICIYHKPEDVLEIPQYILSLVPEYRFYIRHHSTWIWDTVLYAVL